MSASNEEAVERLKEKVCLDDHIDVTVELSLADLANHLAFSVGNEALLEFLKELDSQVNDWDFTDAVIEWAREMREEKEGL